MRPNISKNLSPKYSHKYNQKEVGQSLPKLANEFKNVKKVPPNS